MNTITVTDLSQPGELDNPKLNALAQQTLETAILAAHRVLANRVAPSEYPMPQSRDCFEAHFKTYLETRAPEHMELAAQKAHEFLTNTSSHSQLRSIIDLKSERSVEDQVTAKGVPERLRFSEQELKTLTSNMRFAPQPTGPGPDEGFRPQQDMNSLALQIEQVHCDRVTGVLGWADDDIYLGAISTNSIGKTIKINPYNVGSFSDGRTVNYNPPKPIANFDLMQAGFWPQSFFVTLVFVEKHDGSMYDFVQQLYDKINGLVKDKITAAVGAGVGGVVGGIVGSAIPGIGTIIGAAVGAAIGWVLGKLFDWLKGELFGDDIFKPLTSRVDIPSKDSLSPGQIKIHTGFNHYTRFHADYHLYWHWQSNTPPAATPAPAPAQVVRCAALWNQGNAPQLWLTGYAEPDVEKKTGEVWKMMRFTQAYGFVVNEAVRYNCLYTDATHAQVWWLNCSEEQFRQKTGELWSSMRPEQVQPFVTNGGIRYSCIWNPGTYGQVWWPNCSEAEFRTKTGELWATMRPAQVFAFVISGQIRYSCLWKEGTHGQVWWPNCSEAEFRSKTGELWKSMRPSQVQPFVVGNQVRYSCLWNDSTAAQVWWPNLSEQDFEKRTGELWKDMRIAQIYSFGI